MSSAGTSHNEAPLAELNKYGCPVRLETCMLQAAAISDTMSPPLDPVEQNFAAPLQRLHNESLGRMKKTCTNLDSNFPEKMRIQLACGVSPARS